MILTTVITVWDKTTEALLFEGASTAIRDTDVRKIVDPNTGPGDLLFSGIVFPITEEEGHRILSLMGLKFDGSGDFHLSRERVVTPGEEI